MDERWYEWPDWAKDAVVCDTSIRFGWRDRLRILCRGRATCSTKTFTEHVVGRAETLSRADAEPLWRGRPGGYVASSEPDGAGG